MSEQNPYEQLGVTEDSSFEEIQEAKNRLTQKYREDTKLVQNIEAAYDAIIMDRLRMRQEGRIKVPERIRFPKKNPETPPNLNPIPANNSPQWLQELIDTPSKDDLLWSAGIFLVLSGIVLFASAANPSVISLTMALGFGANIYLLNRKENRFGRAVLLTLLGLFLGVGLGTLLAGTVQTTLSSLGVPTAEFATLVTFFVFWLISSFLR